MMAINYVRMRATSKRLLTQNGTTYQGERPGKVDHVAGEEVTTPAENITVIGVKTAYKPNEIDGKNIQSGDVQIVATADTLVDVGDVLFMDDQRWRVENPWPVKPADILICYRLQLRGV